MLLGNCSAALESAVVLMPSLSYPLIEEFCLAGDFAVSRWLWPGHTLARQLFSGLVTKITLTLSDHEAESILEAEPN